MIRQMGFRKADDSAKVVTQKVMQRLRAGDSAVDMDDAVAELTNKREKTKPTGSSSSYGINVEGINDVMLRLAKCCRPVPVAEDVHRPAPQHRVGFDAYRLTPTG